VGNQWNLYDEGIHNQSNNICQTAPNTAFILCIYAILK